MVVIIATKATDTAERTAELFMTRWFCRGMGMPQAIVSDHVPIFASDMWTELVRILKVNHTMSTARHQQSDGRAENMVKQVKTAITKLYAQGERNIEGMLPFIEFALYNSINEITGFTPFYLA
jgi:transposase InsO family protein